MPALTIAVFTSRDLFRRRVLVILGLFGLAMVLLSFPLRELTIGQWQRLIIDLGLGGIDFSLTLIAVFLGATLIAGDLERRTLYPLLAKPISRSTFVIGKFLGLGFVLLVLAAAMGAGMELMLLAARQPLSLILNSDALAAIVVSTMLVGAMSIFFSSFTSATLAAIFCLALTIIGHFIENLVYFASKSETLFGRALSIIARLLPDFELINLKDYPAHQQAVALGQVLQKLTYGLVYSVLVVCLSVIIFSRRDLK